MRYPDQVAGIPWERIEAIRNALKGWTALHFIGGEFRPSESGEVFPTLDPSTNEVLSHAARGGEREVDRAAKAAHEAFQWKPKHPARPRWPSGLPAISAMPPLPTVTYWLRARPSWPVSWQPRFARSSGEVTAKPF